MKVFCSHQGQQEEDNVATAHTLLIQFLEIHNEDHFNPAQAFDVKPPCIDFNGTVKAKQRVDAFGHLLVGLGFHHFLRRRV